MNNDKKPQEKQELTYSETLADLGFGFDEIKIYEYLLKNHSKKASEIGIGTGISRVLAYRGLDKLCEKGVIEKIEEEGSPAYFEAKHPSFLTTVLERQKQKLAKAELEIERDLGKMSSDFNLATGKPNVQFFEGKDGMAKVAKHSLTSETEILQYIDSEIVLDKIPELNISYIEERKRKGIHKKMLVPNTEFMRKRSAEINSEYTEVRFIKNLDHFPNIMQIYDNKVSYITFTENKYIGILIEDADIYTMHKMLFIAQWEQALE